jgi:hypothetical protein
MRANLKANARRKQMDEAVLKQIEIYQERERQRERPGGKGQAEGEQQREDDLGDQEDQSLDLDEDILQCLRSNLSPEGAAAVDALSRTAAKLGVMPASRIDFEFTTTMARRILAMTRDLLELERQLLDFKGLTKQYNEEKLQVQQDIATLRERNAHEEALDEREDAVYQQDDGCRQQADQEVDGRVPLNILHAQTSEFNASMKQLQSKIKEYQDRAAALTRTIEAQTQDEEGEELTIESVQHMESIVQQRRSEVQRMEERLKKYHGLPPDVGSSREEVARATSELETWRRRREVVFEELSQD